MLLSSILAHYWLLGIILAVDAFNCTITSLCGNTTNASHPANTSSDPSLLPPYYRDGTTGTAWVFPASPFDLRARAITCECFDPAGTFEALGHHTEAHMLIPSW